MHRRSSEPSSLRLTSTARAGRVVTATAVLGCIAGMLWSPAGAHGRANVTKAKSGSRTEIGFVVEHGCNGSPTVKVALKLPPGVTKAVPTAKAGWTATVDTTASTVTFAGGSLSATKHGTFSVAMTLPTGKPGTVLTFPMVQTCKVGTLRWIEAPGSKYPAPTVTLT